MRGVALVVAVTIVTEVGDFRRFAQARRQLMAYLGLVPSEHSSPEAASGADGITKAEVMCWRGEC